MSIAHDGATVRASKTIRDSESFVTTGSPFGERNGKDGEEFGP
jgi:hypothetical protein